MAILLFFRCLSIPVTLRSVIQKLCEELAKEPVPVEVPSPPPLPQVMQKSENNINHTHQGPMQVEQQNFGNYPPPMYPNNPPPYGGFYPPPPPPPPPAAPQPVCNYGNAPPYMDYGHAHSGMDSLGGDKISSNPLLATLLDQESQSPENSPITESPMLSKLLDDNISVVANVPTLSKQRRPSKRRSKSEMSVGRSPKHRLSESDKSLSAIELDSSNSSFDSDLQLPPPGGGKAGNSSVMIDLTDPEFACESHVKKLENSLDNFIQKESRNYQSHGASGDFTDIPLDYIEGRPIKTEIDNTSPPNSSHHPKNGNISTSLEDLLDGSREVRDHVDPEYLLNKGKLSHQNSLSSVISKSQNSSHCLEEPMEFDTDILDPSNNTKIFDPLSVGTIKMEIDKTYDSESSKLGQAAMIGSKSGSTSSYGNIFSVFEKLEFKQSMNDVQDLKTMGSSDKYERTANSLVELERNIKIKTDHQIKTEDVPAMKLKLVGMNKLESKLSSASFHSMDMPQSTKAASKSTETFDFNSDDDDPYIMRCDKTMTVVSSSPTRLQISKSKNSLKLVSKESKSEKCKRKEYKHGTSTQKRKKEKDGYKKERKKKKVNDSVYSSSSVQEPTMYRSTVETNGPNDFKRMPILKITKSGVTLSTESSPKTQSPIPKDKDKVDTSKRQSAPDLTMHLNKLSSSKCEKSTQKESSKCSKSPSQKSSKSHRSLSSSASITVNKADSKLMNRTPTIKLKPIDLTTSASVSVAAKTPPATVATSPKITVPTPTSATIGRIGAVSLATSTSSSPKGTASSSPGTISKLSSTSHSLNKSSSTSSAKSSSPNLNRSSSGSSQLTSKSSTPPSSSRCSSQSSLSSGKSSSSRMLSSSAGKSRSSSPSVMKNSSSKISSGNVKSTGSSGKSSQSSTTSSAMTAASVLSFLNTNASKIASLPPIPKVNSSSASHGTSSKMPSSSQSGSVTKSVTTASNSTSSKFSSSSSTMSNKVVSSSSTSSANKSVMSLPGGTKGNNSSNKSSNSFTGSKMASVSNGTNTSNKQNTTPTTGTSSVSKSVSSSASVSKSSSSSSPNTGVQNKVQVTTVNSGSGNVIPAATTMAAPSMTANNKCRPRKGSLSAVIDKLTKANVAGFQPDGVEDSVHDNDSPEDREILNEKFLQASGDLLRAIDGELNSWTKHEQGGDSDNSRILFGNEAVQSSGGASRDSVTSNCVQQMESENSGQSKLPVNVATLSPTHRHSPTAAISRQNSSSSKSHGEGHDPKTVNPRHVRKNCEASTSSSKKSSSRSRESSPQVGIKANSQDNAKVSDKSNKSSVNLKKEPFKSESASDISVKRNKDTDSVDHAINVQHRTSPVKKSKSDSPYVAPNSKFNGETNRDCQTTNCKDSSSKDKDVFKAPTPKPSLDDKDSEDIENLVVRRKQRSSKPLLSPGSPGSSPENGLIIDCPASPRHLQNRTNSPQPNVDITSETRDKLSNSAWLSSSACTPSPKVKQASILTPSPKVKQSPITSSPYKEHSNPCSVSNNSPYNIDDDLMDEALMA